MSAGRAAATVLAIAVGVPGMAPTLAAGESGSFSVIRSYIRDYATLEHAVGTLTAGTLEGTATTLASSGEPFTEGEHSLIKCMVYAKSTAEGMNLEAPCTTTDASGEQWYTLSHRSGGDLSEGGGGGGRWELMGGTGKYAGVTGSCTYETSYLAENQVVTEAKCAWQRQ